MGDADHHGHMYRVASLEKVALLRRSRPTLEVDMNRKSSKFLTRKTIYKVVIAVSAQITLTFTGVTSHALAASPVQVTSFGSNPGNLSMFKYIPSNLKNPAPLVVVLHGCLQESPTFA